MINSSYSLPLLRITILILSVCGSATTVKINLKIAVLDMLINLVLFKYKIRRIKVINYTWGTAPLPCTPPWKGWDLVLVQKSIEKLKLILNNIFNY